MPELLLQRADDSGQYDSTLVRFQGETTYSSHTLYPRHFRNATNPMMEAIKTWLKDKLKISRKNLYRKSWHGNSRNSRGYYTPAHLLEAEDTEPTKTVEFSHVITIGEEGFMVYFNKKGTRYFINGIMGNKSVLIAALARTIFKSCFTDDAIELENFLIKHIPNLLLLFPHKTNNLCSSL